MGLSYHFLVIENIRHCWSGTWEGKTEVHAEELDPGPLHPIKVLLK